MKIAIITGASSGIGKAFAYSLDCAALDEIWLVGRNTDKLNEIKAQLKTPSRAISLDLNDKASYTELDHMIKVQKCDIEYLILSAGIGYTGRLEELTLTEIVDTISINCTALSAVISVALPYMKAGSKILTIASGAGFLPQPEFSVYAATKAYVISLSRSLRKELSTQKINVTAVCPGPVDTEFFAGLKNVKEYKKKYLISPQKVVNKSLKAVKKNKPLCLPTFSMKVVHVASKLIPTGLILNL